MADRRAVSAEALAAPILVVGAPRSGTTWLAKIIDSHPDVLYRHEPDAVVSGPSPLTAEGLAPLLARWAAETGARTVGKRPYFRKSWQPVWVRGLRALIATGVSAASRLERLGNLRIPDWGVRGAHRLAIKSIGWTEGAPILARALPDSRTILILRHPCGQVASLMRGNRQLRFDLKTEGTDMPFDEAGAMGFAAGNGIGKAGFQALLDSAKYAWGWRAFNEPLYAALATEANVHVVLYEALCAEPDVVARRLLTFADLDWNRQTEAFVARSSTHQGKVGYYAIFRNAVAAAEAWRSTMSATDQDAVRSVVLASPLGRFWPDLVSGD